MVTRLNPAGAVRPAPRPTGPGRQAARAGEGFARLLEERLEELWISQHARQRLESSKVKMTEDDWERVRRAVDKAASKGARESLVLMDNLALVISVKNRTVITAVDDYRMKENIFTNIDSAVII